MAAQLESRPLADATVTSENRRQSKKSELMGKATERPKTAERWVTAAFGALFVGAAIAIAYLLAEDHSVGALAAAVALGILGIDALVSAARNRRSLLSRIGPLP